MPCFFSSDILFSIRFRGFFVTGMQSGSPRDSTTLYLLVFLSSPRANAFPSLNAYIDLLLQIDVMALPPGALSIWRFSTAMSLSDPESHIPLMIAFSRDKTWPEHAGYLPMLEN